MYMAGYVPVHRGNKESGRAAIARCEELLKQGVWVFFFPEGTRKIDGSSGPLGPFKPGAFKVALECNVPIVPVTISGARDLMPARGLPTLGYGTPQLTVHAPIETAGKSVEELMELSRAALASGLRPCDELRPSVRSPEGTVGKAAAAAAGVLSPISPPGTPAVALAEAPPSSGTKKRR
jgi:1-acyl-sn-glycerol-3-phosphate acyltransferase